MSSVLHKKIRRCLTRHPIALAYFALALMWGTTMTIIVPPFQVPDEETHYYRASAIVEGSIVCENGKLSVEQERTDFVMFMNPNSLIFDEDARFDRNKLTQYRDSGNTNNTTVSSPSCSSLPAPHLLPALAITVAETAGGSELTGFYMARIINVVLSAFLLSAAIAITPVGKKLLFVIGMLPMFVFLAGSINYDAVVLPAALLFTAIILRLAFNGKARIPLLILASLLYLLVVAAKPGYAPLVLVFGILSGSSLFRKWWQTALFIALISVTGMLMLALLLKTGGGMSSPEWVLPDYQKNFILTQPFEYLVVIARTLWHNGAFYLMSFIGVLGWLDYRVPPISFIAVTGLFGVAVLSELRSTTFSLNIFSKIATTTALTGTALLILTSMFLYSTHPDIGIIEGVQGRYFIPLAFPAGVLLVSLFPKSKQVREKITKFMTPPLISVLLAVFLIFVIGGTILATLIRYYS